MKKFLSTLIVLVLSCTLFLFVGCGESDQEQETGPVVVNGLTIENGVVTKYEPTSDSGVELVIPEKAGDIYVTEIAKEVFNGCKAIKTVTLPVTIKKIGSKAFMNCTKLEGVYITDMAGWCAIDFVGTFANPVANINCGKLYLNNELITKLTFPSYVTRIESRAFYSCTCIKEIIIHKDINFIGQHAFYGITGGLERFTFLDTKNWGYANSATATKGSELSYITLGKATPVENDDGWRSAIGLYRQFGQFFWVKSAS